MASERFWRQIVEPFASNGTSNGVIVVDDSEGFKVKAEVLIEAIGQPVLTVEIKDIPDAYTILVGPKGAEMQTRSDLSLYTVAQSAKITQKKQKRPSIGPGEYERAVYEEEPIVAKRVIPVGRTGELIDQSIDGVSPQEWDDAILTRDIDKDVVYVEFYLNSKHLWDIDITRDIDKDVVRVRKVNP